METKTRTFKLGRTVISPNAQKTLYPEDVFNAMQRHARCDWGNCSQKDALEKVLSLRERFRHFSVYHDRAGTRFWIITEADRSATTILLPEDY